MKNFQARHHSNMLRDQTRIQFFSRALSSIPNLETVVDVGSGTGILSALALRQGAEKVISIEFFRENCSFIEHALARFKNRSQVVCASSYNVTLELSAQTLVSETIGLLGPEENIVEIMFDFVQRNQSIKNIIPAKLKVCAQFMYSKKIEQDLQEICDPIMQYSNVLELPTECDLQLKDALAHELISMNHSKEEFEILSGKIVLKEYRLGHDFDSSFTKTLAVENGIAEKANVVHLFFEAEFSEFLLSTHVGSPITHWMHSFIALPESRTKKKLTVSFVQGSSALDFLWH
jgi:protein arginine N-methyltransferase 1